MNPVWIQLGIGLVLFFVIIAVLGQIATKKTKTTNDFAVAGRSLGPFVVAMTMVSTYGSASSFIGNPGLAYQYGWPMAWIWIGCIPGIIIPILFFGPRMRTFSVRYNTLTIPDMVGTLYNSNFLRTFVAFGIVVFYIPMMVAQFKGVGVLFEAFFDINFTWATIVFGIIMIFYSAKGGMFAVAWTDTAQGVLMAIMMIIVVPVSIYSVGGWTAMNEKLVAISSTLNGIFEPELYTPLTALFMVIYYGLWQIGQPYMSTRFFALNDLKSFKKVVIYTIIITAIISSGMWAGIAGRILFPSLSEPDAVMPQFISVYFPTYLGTLAMLGVLAAILTTVSSILLAVGTTVGYDLAKKSFNFNLSDKQTLNVSQAATFTIGILSLVISLFNTPDLLSLLVYAALGGTACLVVGPITIGLFDKGATPAGGIAGSVISVVLFLILLFGLDLNVWISGGTGMIASILITFIVSRMTGEPSEVVKEMHS